MEANREAAEECASRGRTFLMRGDLERAEKFLTKAQRLYPDLAGLRELMVDLKDRLREQRDARQSPDDNGGSSSSAPPPPPPPRPSEPSSQARSNNNSSPPADTDSGAGSSSSASYTPEDREAITRILSCRSLYEVLCVERSASEKDIVKAYRKLALRVHPDKNRHPKAQDAFKRLTEAFTVLNTADKRRIYDERGEEGLKRGGGAPDDMHFAAGMPHGMTAEDYIFYRFFGGPSPFFAQPGMRRRHARTADVDERDEDEYMYARQQRGPRPPTENIGLGQLVHLLPILLIVVVSLLSTLGSSPSSPWSMEQTDVHTVPMTVTENNETIPFWVTKEFYTENRQNPHNMKVLREKVKREAMRILTHMCQNERNEERIRKESRNRVNAKYEERPLASCERLESLLGRPARSGGNKAKSSLGGGHATGPGRSS